MPHPAELSEAIAALAAVKQEHRPILAMISADGGRERGIGSYRLDRACLVLFKLPTKTGMRFKRMLPPRD